MPFTTVITLLIYATNPSLISRYCPSIIHSSSRRPLIQTQTQAQFTSSGPSKRSPLPYRNPSCTLLHGVHSSTRTVNSIRLSTIFFSLSRSGFPSSTVLHEPSQSIQTVVSCVLLPVRCSLISVKERRRVSTLPSQLSLASTQPGSRRWGGALG